MPGPLSHLRILDLSRVLAGPWATQLLADLGAEVIKVERPAGGDDTRGWGPPFLDADPSRRSAYFLAANRGKRSVTIDISRPEGQELVRQLALRCDVVVENYKVGGLAKYGLDAASLRAVKPDLVYCSITGFGQDGPYAGRAGYDFMIQAMGGLMSVTGERDGRPGGGPQKVGVAIADLMTGMYATVAILAALAHRDRTGEGQAIDLALLDVQVAFLANQALNYLVSGVPPQRLGNAHPNIVPYEAFATADGHIILAVGNDEQFARFCAVAGRPELAEAPGFRTNAERVGNREAVSRTCAELLRARPSRWWLEALAAAGVPCGPIHRLDEVFEDPQVRHRGLRVTLTDEDGVATPGVANPIRFSELPACSGMAPPALGRHTDQVLKDLLGLEPEAIAALRRQGVI